MIDATDVGPCEEYHLARHPKISAAVLDPDTLRLQETSQPLPYDRPERTVGREYLANNIFGAPRCVLLTHSDRIPHQQSSEEHSHFSVGLGATRW